jgi:large subunit ribosomal protein L25
MEDAKLIAKKRDLKGSGNSRRVRRAGDLPAVMYGEGKEATSIQLNAHEFELLLHHHTSENVIVELAIEGEKDVTVLVKSVQHHPVTGEMLHVDLQMISMDKPITVEIALELVGDAAGVKMGGTLDHIMHSIEVECLPGDLVELIEIDVSDLEIGDAFLVSQIPANPKLTLLAEDDAVIAAVSEPRVEEEEESEEAAGEPEVITEKKDEE